MNWLRLQCLLLWLLPIAGAAQPLLYPSFSAPLVQDQKLYFFKSYYGTEVLAFDLEQRRLSWRVDLEKPIESVWSMGPDRVMVCQPLQFKLINPETGRELKTRPEGGEMVVATSPQTEPVNRILYSGSPVQDVRGHQQRVTLLDGRDGQSLQQSVLEGKVLFVDSQNRVFSADRDAGKIHCYSPPLNKPDWSYTIGTEDFFFVEPAEPFLFLFLNPKTVISGNRPPEENSQIICLDATQGTVVWQESIPLSRKMPALFGSTRAGSQYILFVTPLSIRLLDNVTAETLKRIPHPRYIHGADFYGEKKLVIASPSQSGNTSSFQTRDLHSSQVASEFNLPIPEIDSVNVQEEVLLVDSSDRHYGVDLRKQKIIWEALRRRQTVAQGKIYFGGNELSNSQVSQYIVGVCHPETGHTEVLYSERSSAPVSD